MAISKGEGDIAEEGAGCCNVCNVHERLRNLQGLQQAIKVIEYHNEHLTISKEIGDREAEGTADGNLGNTYQCLANWQQAKEYHKKHLTITK